MYKYLKKYIRTITVIKKRIRIINKKKTMNCVMYNNITEVKVKKHTKKIKIKIKKHNNRNVSGVCTS